MQSTKKPIAATDFEALLRIPSVERLYDENGESLGYRINPMGDNSWAAKHRRLLFDKAAWDQEIPSYSVDMITALSTINQMDLNALEETAPDIRLGIIWEQLIQIRAARLCRWWWEHNGGAPLSKRQLYPAAAAFGLISEGNGSQDLDDFLVLAGLAGNSVFGFVDSNSDPDKTWWQSVPASPDGHNLWAMFNPNTQTRTCWQEYLQPERRTSPLAETGTITLEAKAIGLVAKILRATERNSITHHGLILRATSALRGIDTFVRRCILELVQDPVWLELKGFSAYNGLVSLRLPRSRSRRG